MQIIFNVISVLLVLWLLFMWSSNGALNCLIKVVLFALFTFGCVVSYQSMSGVVIGAVRLV